MKSSVGEIASLFWSSIIEYTSVRYIRVRVSILTSYLIRFLFLVEFLSILYKKDITLLLCNSFYSIKYFSLQVIIVSNTPKPRLQQYHCAHAGLPVCVPSTWHHLWFCSSSFHVRYVELSRSASNMTSRPL